jgi:chitinase
MLRFLSPLLVLCFLSPFANAFVADSASRPLLVGYFPQWGIYNNPPYYVKDLVTSGSAPLLDQLNYAQGFIVNAHCAVADPNADLNLIYTALNSIDGKPDKPSSRIRGSFHQLQKLKKRYPRMKTLISLEGNAASFAEAAKPGNRVAFVSSCINTFIRGRFAPGIKAPGIFDGFDIDWEYPAPEDAPNYVALLEEFRKQLDTVQPGLKLTIAAGPNPSMYHGVDFAAVTRIVDLVGLMNYDYSGPWRKETGLHAPLYSEHGGSADRTIHAYLAAGVPEEKLLLGIPFYGYSWKSVGSDNNGLFQPGEAVHQDRPYRYIQTLIDASTVYRDPTAQAPWLYDGDTFWTYEDAISARFKGEYAQQNHLGGVMVWELGEDSSDAQLLKSVSTGLRSPVALPQTAAASPVLGGEESGAAKK